MTSVVFLTVDQVVRLHRHSIDRYGGSHGLRDLGLLESAVLSPQQTFGGEYRTKTWSRWLARFGIAW